MLRLVDHEENVVTRVAVTGGVQCGLKVKPFGLVWLKANLGSGSIGQRSDGG
jgi:hypothetical protein